MNRRDGQTDLLVVVDMQTDFVDGTLGSAVIRMITNRR